MCARPYLLIITEDEVVRCTFDVDVTLLITVLLPDTELEVTTVLDG